MALIQRIAMGLAVVAAAGGMVWMARHHAETTSRLDQQSHQAIARADSLMRELSKIRHQRDSLTQIANVHEAESDVAATQGNILLAAAEEKWSLPPKPKDSTRSPEPSASDSARYWHEKYVKADSAAHAYWTAWEKQKAATAALRTNLTVAWAAVDSLQSVNADLRTALAAEVTHRHRSQVTQLVKLGVVAVAAFEIGRH